jgi:hypothetical protein
MLKKSKIRILENKNHIKLPKDKQIVKNITKKNKTKQNKTNKKSN